MRTPLVGISLRPSRAVLTAALFLLLSIRLSAKSYLEYYRSIAKAEEAAVQGRHEEAVARYDSTFSSYPYSNPADCYAAAQIAAFQRDPSRCIAFLCRGLSAGLPVATIKGNPHLSQYMRELSPALIDSCRLVYEAHIDKKARAKMIVLAQKDQSVVRGSGSIYDRGGYRLKPAFRPFWDSLLDEIITLTRESGFPAHRIVGTQQGEDGYFQASPHSNFAYFILIHHGRYWPRIGEMLLAELSKGNITPQMYGALADFALSPLDASGMRYMALRECEAQVSARACRKTRSKRLAEIEAARREIGLCSYEVMRQKHNSTRAYLKWLKRRTAVPKAVFDFPSLGIFSG